MTGSRLPAFALLLTVLLTGCAVTIDESALTELSDEAAILDFVIDGILGTVTIDPTARIITALVEPEDLATVTPVVTVSDGATLGALPALEDGVPETLSVTAQNGDTVSWTVTVTTEPGIGFTMGGERISLTHGFVDSADGAHDQLLGSGTPPAVLVQSRAVYVTDIAAFQDADFDHALAPDAQAYRMLAIYLTGEPAVGEQQSSAQGLPAIQWSDMGVFLDSTDPSLATDDVVVNVLEYGEVGAFVRGTFHWTWDDGAGRAGSMTDGYFKVLRVADGTSLFPVCGNCETF